MVDIIPKTPQSSSLLMKALLTASTAVFAVALGGFAILFFLDSKIQNKIEAAEVILAAEKTPEQIDMEEYVFAARSRLQDFATVVQERSNMAPVFSFVEAVVHPDITFLVMSVDALRQSADMKGRARSFSALDEQFAVLKTREELLDFSLTQIQLGEDGTIEFQITMQFPGDFFQ